MSSGYGLLPEKDGGVAAAKAREAASSPRPDTEHLATEAASSEAAGDNGAGNQSDIVKPERFLARVAGWLRAWLRRLTSGLSR